MHFTVDTVAIKMKAVIAIAVVACFLAVASAQGVTDCANRAAELAPCASKLSAGGAAFCQECANSLISYYNDCANGAGVSTLQAGKPKAWGVRRVQ